MFFLIFLWNLALSFILPRYFLQNSNVYFFFLYISFHFYSFCCLIYFNFFHYIIIFLKLTNHINVFSFIFHLDLHLQPFFLPNYNFTTLRFWLCSLLRFYYFFFNSTHSFSFSFSSYFLGSLFYLLFIDSFLIKFFLFYILIFIYFFLILSIS